MICKGTFHNNGAKLAAYMTASKEGERAELWQLRGFAATNIKDAFRDVHIMAGATKCEQPFFHVQVRNREGEALTRQQWEYAADRIERMLKLTGQPRAITFHTYEHNNDEHMHIAWSRIDEETLTAIPLPFFKERLKKISRELELHFALEPVTNEREGSIKYAPTRAQEEQARRVGVDIHQVRNTNRDCCIEQIAAKVGKSPAYCVARVRLTELAAPVVEAFYAEEIGVGHALLLAKLQPAQQD